MQAGGRGIGKDIRFVDFPEFRLVTPLLFVLHRTFKVQIRSLLTIRKLSRVVTPYRRRCWPSERTGGPDI